MKCLKKTTVAALPLGKGKLAESDRVGKFGDLLEAGITQQVT